MKLNRREQAYYDRLPASLSRKRKLEIMQHWGVKYEVLPEKTKALVHKQAMSDAQSQFVVMKDGKPISIPQHDVLEAITRLGFHVEAELILLKG